MLLFIRNMLRVLRRLLPAGNFELLSNPLAAPAFFADFLNRYSKPARLLLAPAWSQRDRHLSHAPMNTSDVLLLSVQLSGFETHDHFDAN